MALSRTKERALDYPDPYIVQPRSGNHRQSLIILHGRGDEGKNFGGFLLLYPVGEYTGLQDAFPDAKFVFPSASKRRAVAMNRTGINQWFDLRSIMEQEREMDIQFEGLRESSWYVHRLLEAEIEAVGAENVVLWGLSQGAAISMISLLLWTGPNFAATIGMCGWVPLKARMVREVQADQDWEGEANPFEGGKTSEDVSTSRSRGANLKKAARYLREELELGEASAEVSNALLEVQTFIGHGTLEPKVLVELGKDANELMSLLEFDIEFRLYEGLGHWYSSEMLQDIVAFLQQKTQVKPAAGAREDSSIVEESRSEAFC